MRLEELVIQRDWDLEKIEEEINKFQNNIESSFIVKCICPYCGEIQKFFFYFEDEGITFEGDDALISGECSNCLEWIEYVEIKSILELVEED